MGKVESAAEEGGIGTNDVYPALAAATLGVHLLFVLWIVFGVAVTRRHPLLRWLHLGSLAWGILIEILPWTCPLTWAENFLERRAGIAPSEPVASAYSRWSKRSRSTCGDGLGTSATVKRPRCCKALKPGYAADFGR
jgi:Protein of Unknown function (DUF2784)